MQHASSQLKLGDNNNKGSCPFDDNLFFRDSGGKTAQRHELGKLAETAKRSVEECQAGVIRAQSCPTKASVSALATTPALKNSTFIFSHVW